MPPGRGAALRRGERYTKQCERWNRPGHAHELTFSCYQGRALLAKERTCVWLVDAINAARRKHDFDLWAYVFMPNHVHLIICPRQEQYSISSILLSIKQPVARKAIAYLRTNSPTGLQLLATGQPAKPYQFWQKGGGYDRNVTSVEILTEAIQYIHNNPARKGLLPHPTNGTTRVRQTGRATDSAQSLSITTLFRRVRPSPRPSVLTMPPHCLSRLVPFLGGSVKRGLAMASYRTETGSRVSVQPSPRPSALTMPPLLLSRLVPFLGGSVKRSLAMA